MESERKDLVRTERRPGILEVTVNGRTAPIFQESMRSEDEESDLEGEHSCALKKETNHRRAIMACTENWSERNLRGRKNLRAETRSLLPKRQDEPHMDEQGHWKQACLHHIKLNGSKVCAITEKPLRRTVSWKMRRDESKPDAGPIQR